MQFRVLGAVEVDGKGVGQPKQRLLWAVLVCGRGQVVSDDRLLGVLWGESAPRSALSNLRVYVNQLRKVVGDGVIDRYDGGYLLRPAPGDLDADRFEELLGRARVMEDLDEKKSCYTEALTLWRGRAFGSVADHPAVAATAQRLEDLRLAALEELAETRLALGEHAALAGDLGELAAAHPLREGFHAQLMLALYRTSRQTEALAAYQQARRLLADELGIDPGPALQELHQAILRSDPALDLPAEPPGGSCAVTPAELPADLANFTGRADELVRLRGQILDQGRPVVISAISGTGGIGKSALAIHLGHQIADRYPDGQLYVNLQGSTPDTKPLDTIDALGRMLRSLGADPETIPTETDEAAALLRTRTHGKRLLIILDNARDSTQIRPLLPGSDASAALITSRRDLADLQDAHRLALDLLSPKEASNLLTALIGPGRTAAEPGAATEITRLCGYLPLAISIAAARLNSRTTWSLTKLADRLANEERRLSELAQGDRAVRATLQVSYRHLDHQHARAFRLCALPGGPDLDTAAAAALLDLHEPETEDLLDDLVDLGLLENPTPGTYHYHDLLRLLAHEQATEHDPPDERDQALHRLLAYYTATTRNAVETIDPYWAWPRSLQPIATPIRHPNPDAAGAWLHDHAQHLLAAVRQGAATPVSVPLAADLLFGTKWLQFAGVGWDEMESTARSLTEAATTVGDHRSEALGRFRLGDMYFFGQSLTEAATQFERSAELARTIDDPMLLALALTAQRVTYRCQRRQDAAATAGEEAVDLFHRLGHLSEEAYARAGLAGAYHNAGRPDDALTMLEQAADDAHRSGDPDAIMVVSYERGAFLRTIGQHEQAIAELTETLRTCQTAGQRLFETKLLYSLAETHRLADHPAKAVTYAERCLTLSRDVGNEYDAARALTVIGQCHRHQPLTDPERAQACLREAHTLFTRLEAPDAADIRKILDELQ